MEKAKAYRKIGGLEVKDMYYKIVTIENYVNQRISELKEVDSEFGEHYWALREMKKLQEKIKEII